MKSKHSLLALFLLAGCASTGRDGPATFTTVTYKGPPDVVLTVPEHVTERDLEKGFPPIRISGPEGIQAALLIFGDKNGDGEPGAGEMTMRFRALPDAERLLVAGVRLTPMQVSALGGDKKFGVEVIDPGTKKRHFTAYGID